MFALSDRDPLRIRELASWSLESMYQFLYANNIHARKIEASKKTKDNSRRKV